MVCNIGKRLHRQTRKGVDAIRYGQIRRYDVANGPGVRTSLFVTGCPFHCPGCFNEEYQSFQVGELWDQAAEDRILEYLSEDQVSGLSVLGGEPLEQDDALLKLLRRVRQQTGKSIWIWTGHIYEQLSDEQKEIVECADVLVDGPFEQALQDWKLQFRGSSNQRIIDLNVTRLKGEIVLWKSEYEREQNEHTHI